MQLKQEELDKLFSILENSGMFSKKSNAPLTESFLDDDFNWQWWREKILSSCLLEEINDFEIESQSYDIVGKFFDFVSLSFKNL